MSRSYKKTPIVKDHESGRWGKKQANRKVRHHKGIIANGKAYRKVYNPWDIHDSISYHSRHMDLKQREATSKRVLQEVDPEWMLKQGSWEKYYYRK